MHLVIQFNLILLLTCIGSPKYYQASWNLGNWPYLLPSHWVSPHQFLWIIFRLCEGGELFFYITKRKHLTESQAASVMRQAFYALCYLHNNKICHRDIKPENFLLFKEDDDSYVKLIDFGLAKRVSKNEVMNSPNGTPYYIAPEVLKGSYTT